MGARSPTCPGTGIDSGANAGQRSLDPAASRQGLCGTAPSDVGLSTRRIMRFGWSLSAPSLEEIQRRGIVIEQGKSAANRPTRQKIARFVFLEKRADLRR